MSALPVLLGLDRPASALACAALAVVAEHSGSTSAMAKLAAAAVQRRGEGGPQSHQDLVRLDAVLEKLPPADGKLAAVSDDDLLSLLDELS